MEREQSVIIPYSPRPEGHTQTGSVRGYNTAKGNIFSAQHTVRWQNSLLQDFAGVKAVRGLRKNQTAFKTIDLTMAINHHYLMETCRPAHPPKCKCWKLGL